MVDIKISGLHIYYYFVCKRKLWLYQNNISMEDNSEDVSIGHYIDENSYADKRKHILINNEINIDFIKSDGEIHEVKKSKKLEEASTWQVKYYLYYLERHGKRGVRAKIDYPLIKEVMEVDLTDDDRKALDKIIEDIKDILSGRIPEAIIEKKCDKCAYHDICLI